MIQIVLAFVMITTTIVTHLVGLLLLMRLLRRPPVFRSLRPFASHLMGFLLVVWGLVLLHTVEIWAWAAMLHMVGALQNFETALYFSTSSYTTLGYGDIILDRKWRVLGAIEGANGILLLGWSTAFFISVVNRMNLVERNEQRRQRINPQP